MSRSVRAAVATIGLQIGAWFGCALLLLPMCAAGQSQRGPAAARAVMSAEDSRSLAEALAAYDRGEETIARPVLTRLGEKYPSSFAANEAAGILAVEAGEAARALPFLERAAAAEKGNAAAQANLGAAYLATGKSDNAVRVLRRAAALDGKNAETQASLGRALYAEKQPAAAVDAFAAAGALDPTNTEIDYNWAVALYDVRRDGEAAAVLTRIPEAQRTESIESLWGDVEERRGRYQEAVAHLQRAAQLNPSEAAIYAVAVELLRHWSWEPAAKVATFGARQYPASRRMLMAKGIAAYGAGKYVESAGVFGMLLATEPDNESYGSLLGRSCAAAGGAQAPECDSLIAFAEAHPANAQIDVSAAVSLLHQPSPEQHLDQAQGLLERAIAADAKDADAYYQLGVLEQQRLQWRESAVSLGKAVTLRPSFAEAHYRLSRAYSHTGDPDRAKAEIALQQRYSQQEKDETNARLKEVTTFLLASH